MNEADATKIAQSYMRKLGFNAETANAVKVRFREPDTLLARIGRRLFIQNNSNGMPPFYSFYVGRCLRKSKIIELSASYARRKTHDYLDMLIAHEATHFRVLGHGAEFRRVLHSINPTAVHFCGDDKAYKDYDNNLRRAMQLFD
jgi:hypothetical protein